MEKQLLIVGAIVLAVGLLAGIFIGTGITGNFVKGLNFTDSPIYTSNSNARSNLTYSNFSHLGINRTFYDQNIKKNVSVVLKYIPNLQNKSFNMDMSEFEDHNFLIGAGYQYDLYSLNNTNKTLYDNAKVILVAKWENYANGTWFQDTMLIYPKFNGAKVDYQLYVYNNKFGEYVYSKTFVNDNEDYSLTTFNTTSETVSFKTNGVFWQISKFNPYTNGTVYISGGELK